MPRLSLTSEQFRSEVTGKLYSVVDLAESGMGLLLMDPADQADFAVGLLLSGSLNLHRTKYPVMAVVRHLSGDRVGCAFTKLAEPVKQAIAQFLDPNVLGMDLRPVPTPEASLGATSMEPQALWFHGSIGTELWVHRQLDGQCSSLLLAVFNQFVKWERETGLSTGKTEVAPEKREWDGIARHETLLLHPDFNPDQQKLTVAKKLILSSNLSSELKTWCGRYFRFDCVN